MIWYVNLQFFWVTKGGMPPGWQVWCEWIEMELRHKEFDEALKAEIGNRPVDWCTSSLLACSVRSDALCY